MNSLETEDEYFILYVFVINMMIEKWEVLFDDITKVIKFDSVQFRYFIQIFFLSINSLRCIIQS